MKLVFTLSNGTPTAHLVDGETQTALPVKMCKDGLTLEVPENPTNRRWLKLATLQAKGEVILEAKAKRILGSYTKSATTKKAWTEYLTDDELATYNDLKAKGEARKAEAEKPTPKSEAEKLKERLAKLQAQYDALVAEDGKAE